MKQIRYQRGVTLIELMIGMVVGLVILIGIIQTMMVSKSASQTQQSMSAIAENARFAFEFMNRDLRMAGYQCNPVCGGEHYIRNNAGVLESRYKNTAGEVVVTQYSLTADGELRYSKSNDGVAQFTNEVLITGLEPDIDGDGTPDNLQLQFGVFDKAAASLRYMSSIPDPLGADESVVSVRVTLTLIDGGDTGGPLDIKDRVSTTIALRNPVIDAKSE